MPVYELTNVFLHAIAGESDRETPSDSHLWPFDLHPISTRASSFQLQVGLLKA